MCTWPRQEDLTAAFLGAQRRREGRCLPRCVEAQPSCRADAVMAPTLQMAVSVFSSWSRASGRLGAGAQPLLLLSQSLARHPPAWTPPPTTPASLSPWQAV